MHNKNNYFMCVLLGDNETMTLDDFQYCLPALGGQGLGIDG